MDFCVKPEAKSHMIYAQYRLRGGWFGNRDHTTIEDSGRNIVAEFFKLKIGLCVDGITTSAHRVWRLLGYLQSRKRGCESLEREGRGITGRGQSGQVGTPFSFPMPDCDGVAPQGKSARLFRDASPFALRITTGETS